MVEHVEGHDGSSYTVGLVLPGLPPDGAGQKPPNYVAVSGKPSKQQLEACWELGGTLAAQLMG